MTQLSPGDRQQLELEGARLASLLVGWKWIDRRVESVTYLGETTVQREVSITLTLPDHIPSAIYVGPTRAERAGLNEPPTASDAQLTARDSRRRFYYVPLTLIDKEKITRFDFTDERGASLPLLSSQEKGVMAAGLLLALARQALRGEGMSLPDSIADELRGIAELSPKQARRLLDCFMERSDLGGVFAVLHGPSRNARVLRALLPAFASCYIMVVPLVQGEHHKRMVKFSYEEDLTFKFALPVEGNILRRMTRWCGLHARETLRSLGWQARQIWLGAPAYGHGGTYHLVMNAPPGTKITQLTLVGLTVRPGMDESEVVMIGAEWHARYAPHVFSRDKKPGALGVAYAKIRVVSPIVIRAACFSAIGTAGALVVGHHFIGHLLTEKNDFAGAGAALLLVVPTATSIYIARIQEHPMVTGMLFGVRLMTLLSAASAFVAASVLILAHYGQAKGNWQGEAETTWVVCEGFAALAALVLTGTYFATWKEDQPLGRRWKHYKARWATPPTYPPPPPPE